MTMKHHEEISLLPVVTAYCPLIALGLAALWSKIKDRNKNNDERKKDHEPKTH